MARSKKPSGKLTPEEYASARTSTLNAHYSRPAIVRAIYEAVGNMLPMARSKKPSGKPLFSKPRMVMLALG